AIFSWAGAADTAKHPGKVLLRFESARHGNIKNAYLVLTQHSFCALYLLAQDKFVRRLTCRLAKHSRKVSWAQGHGLRHFDEGQLVFHLRTAELLYRSQSRGTESTSTLPPRPRPHRVTINQCQAKRVFD